MSGDAMAQKCLNTRGFMNKNQKTRLKQSAGDEQGIGYHEPYGRNILAWYICIPTKPNLMQCVQPSGGS